MEYLLECSPRPPDGHFRDIGPLTQSTRCDVERVEWSLADFDAHLKRPANDEPTHGKACPAAGKEERHREQPAAQLQSFDSTYS